MRKVFGIVEFAEALFCAADSLGQTVNISLAERAGTLTLPSLPEWGENEQDPLHKPLLGPPLARERGKEARALSTGDDRPLTQRELPRSNWPSLSSP